MLREISLFCRTQREMSALWKARGAENALERQNPLNIRAEKIAPDGYSMEQDPSGDQIGHVSDTSLGSDLT